MLSRRRLQLLAQLPCLLPRLSQVLCGSRQPVLLILQLLLQLPDLHTAQHSTARLLVT